jgi:hypothetical protein
MPVVALTLVNSGHNLLRDLVTGADSAKTMYFALGTGTSATTAGQTTLVNEQFRKNVSSYTNGIAVGEGLINCFISDSDAVGLVVGEVAIFSGVSATSSSNSGKMLGRGLWSHTKTNVESLQLQLDITV